MQVKFRTPYVSYIQMQFEKLNVAGKEILKLSKIDGNQRQEEEAGALSFKNNNHGDLLAVCGISSTCRSNCGLQRIDFSLHKWACLTSP